MIRVLLAALVAALCLAPSARAEWREESSGAWVYVADVRPAKSPDCPCPPGTCPACPVVVLPDVRDAVADAPVTGHYVQQCDGRSCKLVWVPDTAKPAAAPVTTSATVSESPRRSVPIRRIFGRLFQRVRGGGCCGG